MTVAYASFVNTATTAPRYDLVRTVAFWVQRVQSRRALAELTDAQLEDCGLCRADVTAEMTKAFWQD